MKSSTKFKFPCIMIMPAAPRKGFFVTYLPFLPMPIGYQPFLGYHHICSPSVLCRWTFLSQYGQETFVFFFCLEGGERGRAFAMFSCGFCPLSREGNSGLHSTLSNYQRVCTRKPGWQENRLISVNLKVLDTQVDGETWRRCKIGLFRPEEIQLLQNNKSATTQLSFYIFLNDFIDDNIGHSVVDYYLSYCSQ